MEIRKTQGESLFNALNLTLLALFSLLCLFPFMNILAVSLSNYVAATSGHVYLWPVGFTLKTYAEVLSKSDFVIAFMVSVKRVLLGTVICLIITVITAYPLSRSDKRFKSRTIYVWYFVTTMFVSGGLIPVFLIVRATGLIDSLWALILPGAVQVYNITILLNFFRGLPKELEDSASLDGAGHVVYLLRVALPLSIACIMTLTLFTVVYHWNSWFDGLIYMNRTEYYPLQTLIQTTVLSTVVQKVDLNDPSTLLRTTSLRSMRAAEVMVTSIPVLLAYPFIQKYFITGITLGSVKE